MKKIALISIIVLIGIAGLGVLSYIQGWYPFALSDQEVLSRTFTKMGEVKTLHYDLTAKFEQVESSSLNSLGLEGINLRMIGDFDNSDTENPKSKADLEIGLSLQGMDMFLKGELISSREKAYYKIVTIPAPITAFLEMFGLDVSKMENQWIEVDVGEMSDLSEEKIAESKKMLEEIAELFEGREFLKINEKFPDDKIGDKKVYHFLVSLNVEVIEALLPDLFDILSEYDEDGAFSEIDKEEFIENFRESSGKIEEMDFELWIGTKDYLLYRFKIEEEITTEEETAKITVNCDLSDFDQEINIEVPENAKSIEEVFPVSELSGQPMYLIQ
jgi:hypothetical protein